MKFSFYKDPKNKQRDMDYFPEGTIIEFIPDKKITYTWVHPNISDFPKTIVTWEYEEIENNRTRLILVHTRDLRENHRRENCLKTMIQVGVILNELEKYCKGEQITK